MIQWRAERLPLPGSPLQGDGTALRGRLPSLLLREKAKHGALTGFERRVLLDDDYCGYFAPRFLAPFENNLGLEEWNCCGCRMDTQGSLNQYM